MRRLVLIATATATATLAAAAPAAAQTQAIVAGSVVQSLAADSTSCLRGTGTKVCADYQERLIQSVGRTAAAKDRTISVHELGRRQLDALVASIN